MRNHSLFAKCNHYPSEGNLVRIMPSMSNLSRSARLIVLSAVIILHSCFFTLHSQERWLGGDISMLPVYEKNGAIYKDGYGNEVKPLDFFHTAGWNCMRVRIFVNPENANKQHKDEGVCQDLPYVTELCRAIQANGYAIMLDFHYSDTWADPEKQYTPQLWESESDKGSVIYQYTRYVLTTLKSSGVTPQFIQVGNEITNGMCWPTGKIDPTQEGNWDVFTDLVKAGVKGCREVCPESKVIIHTEKGGDWAVTKSFYSKLAEYNVDYDIIGLSYYPMWHGTVPNFGQTISNLAEEFPDKPVMVVEAAYYYSHRNDPWAANGGFTSEDYPTSVKGQESYARDLVDELLQHQNVTGLFWWFPEENAFGTGNHRGWLNRGLFDNESGRALPAIYQMSRFIQ